MTDPYFITGPASVSFSGGRTSAFMLHEILKAHGGTLPSDVHVCFANTGKEREPTLRFVHECAIRWNVPVKWLEFVTDLKRAGPAGRIKEVGINSASRNGEPLDRLIARKQALFSTLKGRWCTEKAKVETLIDYMATLGHCSGSFTEVIGFRADEYDRVVELPLKQRNVNRRFAFPMAKASVRKADIEAFWWGQGRTYETSIQPQGFDLELRKGMGNCDHCPFLSDKARISRARRDPTGLDWWAEKEQERKFSFGRISIADIKKHIRANPLLIPDDDDKDAGDQDCIGWCAGEAA